ncbi:MAG: CMP-N-acetlyneuraminic acid synthetase [Dehalococcoidales bacterium]|nr:CMP-N-acetlyneuraminic acid synthetase [Dehalococcoidales bacterium]
MIRGGRVLALIPARAGSKRVPGKNTRLMAGRPMITWSIEAALSSRYIDVSVVSTEDATIQKIAREAGAWVPFSRAAGLAESESSMVDVALDAIDRLREVGEHFDYLVLIQPTSPLRNHQHIDAAVELLCEKGADGVISVTQANHPVEWTKELPTDGSMSEFTGPDFSKRSQEFPARYRINGALYITSVDHFKEGKTFFLKQKCFAFVMRPEDSIDVDSELDFLTAEVLLQNKQRNLNYLDSVT